MFYGSHYLKISKKKLVQLLNENDKKSEDKQRELHRQIVELKEIMQQKTMQYSQKIEKHKDFLNVFNLWTYAGKMEGKLEYKPKDLVVLLNQASNLSDHFYYFNYHEQSSERINNGISA